MKRPPGVTILALLIVLYGLALTGIYLFLLVLGVLHYSGNLPPELVAVLGRWPGIDVLEGTSHFTLGVFALVSGIGMLRLRAWSWLLCMLLLGCELAIQLGSYFQGHSAYLALFITAFLVFYLNQRPIREAFSIEPKSSVELASAHVEPVGNVDAFEPPGALES